MLKLGQLINNRYRIIERIAEGGQSVVYLAADENAFGRRVVVKEFKLSAGTYANLDDAIRQFETSARLLAQLNHPGIVQVIEYFVSRQVPILVTEYVAGHTLEELMKTAWYGLPEPEVIAMAEQLCDVLSYLHRQTPPIIYRDLTPGNMIFSASGRVELIDFGIARTFKAGKSNDTEPLGTMGYAPPEQFGNMQTGPYSDVYSLGAVLLHAATGYDPSQTPFMLPRADTVNGDLKAISPTFTTAVAKATQVDISRRFQTVEDFRSALHKKQPIQGAYARAVAGVMAVVLILCSGTGFMLASALGALPTAIPARVAPVVLMLPTQTPSAEPSLTPAPTVTPSPSATETSEPVTEPSETAMPIPTFLPARMDIPALTPTETPTETPTPTRKPKPAEVTSATPTRKPKPQPRATNTSLPWPTTIPEPTLVPTEALAQQQSPTEPQTAVLSEIETAPPCLPGATCESP